MNPNAPSWGNPQQPNNQQQQPLYQQQYNPYATPQQGQQPQQPQQPQQQGGQQPQQPQQQQQYNPYTQQQQQQFIAAQQFQQQQQYNPYMNQQQQINQQYINNQQPQQQQQYNPYAQQQYINNQPQPQQPQQQQQYIQPQQQFNNNIQYQQNNQNQNNQNNNNNNQQIKYQNNQQNNRDDNWDDDDDDDNNQSQNKPIQSHGNNNNNNNINEMTRSDDDNNQSQNNKKKKKNKRRRKKNKNKNAQNNNENTGDKSQNKSIETNNNEMDIITSKMKDIKIEKPKPKPKSKSKKQSESSKKPIKTASKTDTKTQLKKHIKTEEKEQKTIENTKESKKKKKSRKVKWDAHDPREHLNLVLIGHVDAGKSTISGQILLATNQIDDRTILKYKKEAKEKNRESWWIAYIMDEDDEERNKGKTVECGRAHFDTKNKRYTILDAPGHKNYVPNMISGAQQADVAILVISARRGEFEAGFDRGGQTREHALLALTLGISRIVIVVNKMDTMEWSKQRYDDIKTRVTAFLCDTGFKKKYIDILPISGQDATNIKVGVTKDICGWFKGPTLIETLDSLKKVKRYTGDTLRIPILDRYKGDKGIQAIGKVEAGIMRRGDQIMIMPSEVSANIVGLCIDDEQVDSVGAGENVLITFDKNTVSMDQIYGGCVICGIDKPTKVVETFEAEIYIHEIPGGGIMTKGYQAMFHSHNVSTLCEIQEIPHRLHKKTRKRSKIAPHFLRSHDSAIAKIKLDQKCALEPYEECGALGRFTLRDSGKTVVIGKITKIYASKSRIKNNKYSKEYKTN